MVTFKGLVFTAVLFAVSLPLAAGTGQRIRPALPVADGACPFETIHTGGVADAFAAPNDAIHPSPALTTFLASVSSKSYDDLAINHYFGDSFKLDECSICGQLCSVKVEIVFQGTGGLDCNDTLFIGQAGGAALFSGDLVPGGCNANEPPPITSPTHAAAVDITTKVIDIDPKAFQDLVCFQKYPWLDVITQDDHAVDSMRLVIRH